MEILYDFYILLDITKSNRCLIPSVSISNLFHQFNILFVQSQAFLTAAASFFALSTSAPSWNTTSQSGLAFYSPSFGVTT